jgi:mono/diheme cytochrome c family protein
MMHEPPDRAVVAPPSSASPAVERSLDRQLLLGLVLGALLLAGFPLYALREPERLVTAKREQRELYRRLGAEQYVVHCAGCHGAQAGGGGPAPTLAVREFLGSVTDQQLRWLIAGGSPGTAMSSYHIDLGGPFTDQHIEQVVTYLRSLEAGAPSVPQWRDGQPVPIRTVAAAAPPAVSPFVATPPAAAPALAPEPAGGDGDPSQPTRRDTLSAGRYATLCAACHGARGEGVRNLGPALLTAGYLDTRADTAIFRRIADGVPGTAMMAFVPPRGSLLTAAEARAMVQWMRSPGSRRR